MTDSDNYKRDDADKDKLNTFQCVVFKLGLESYCIDVMQVQEVLRYLDITSVPGTPEFVLGIVNLRGNVVTIIDAKAIFGASKSKIEDITEDYARIIIVEFNEQSLGFLVDEIVDVIDINKSEIDSTPRLNNEEASQFIQGVIHFHQQLIILIDVEKLTVDTEY